MTANISPSPFLRFTDTSTGLALVGGLLYTYATGTTTPQTTYTDSTAGTPNANPIVLDSRGECSCYLNPALAYDFTLKDSGGSTIKTASNIRGALAQADLTGSSGSSLIGFIAASGVQRTAQSKLRDWISAADFGVDATGGTNTAVTLQNAINAAVAAAKSLYVPAGTYELGSTGLTIGGALRIYGEGRNTILRRSVDVATEVIKATNQTDITVENLAIHYTPGTTIADNANSAVHCIGCTNVLVRNVYAYGQFYVGITMEACNKALVTGCEARGMINRGLYVYLACTSVVLSNNFVDGTSTADNTSKLTTYAINVNPGGLGTINRLVIIGNVIKNSTTHGISIAENTRGAVIVGNSISDVGSFYGILVQKANTITGGFTTVTGNNVQNCGQHGIYISESFYVSVTANVCVGNTGDGISLFTAQNCVVSANVCQANTGNGLYLATNSNRNVVTSNQLVSNIARGLVIATADCSFTRYNDNYVYNNTTANILDSGTSSSIGTNLTT